VSGFRLEPAADHALDQIYDYTAREWGNDQADRYIQGLFEYFGDAASRRILWRVIPAEFEVEGYLGKFEHHFVYWKELSSGDIGIAAVLHERMHQIERIRALFENPSA
jgi:plasmid stabilization system protein ParE